MSIWESYEGYAMITIPEPPAHPEPPPPPRFAAKTSIR